MKLTAADKEALSKTPEGIWVYPGQLFHIRRPGWRCVRLAKMGYLEERLDSELYTRYRKSAKAKELAGK